MRHDVRKPDIDMIYIYIYTKYRYVLIWAGIPVGCYSIIIYCRAYGFGHAMKRRRAKKIKYFFDIFTFTVLVFTLHGVRHKGDKHCGEMDFFFTRVLSRVEKRIHHRATCVKSLLSRRQLSNERILISLQCQLKRILNLFLPFHPTRIWFSLVLLC